GPPTIDVASCRSIITGMVKDKLELILSELVDEMRDPVERNKVITDTYDIVAAETDNTGDIMRALADCCVPGVTAAEIATALLLDRWRMSDDKIALLKTMIDAGDPANLHKNTECSRRRGCRRRVTF